MRFLAILWQTYYNPFSQVIKSLNIPEVEFELYSARVLEQREDALSRAIESILTADLVFLYKSSESFWEEVEKVLKNSKLKGKVLCLGSDIGFNQLSNVDYKVLESVQKYILFGGEENLKNLILYTLNTLGGLKVEFETPKPVPWDGIYHPDAKEVFFNLKDYEAWYGELNPLSTVGILFSRHYWLIKNTEVEDALIRELERQGLRVIPVFSYSLKDAHLGTKSGVELIKSYFFDEKERPKISGLIKTTCFFLGAKKGEDVTSNTGAEEGVKFLKELNIPVFSPVSSFYKTVEEWEKEELNADIGWSIALPEFEGVIEPLIIGAQKEEDSDRRKKVPLLSRIERFVKRVKAWIDLRNIPVSKRKLVIILHNNPCASVEATVGCGAHLDTLESVVRILKRLKNLGYEVDDIPETGEKLIKLIMDKKAISEFRWTTVEEIVKKGGALELLDVETYKKWFNELPERTQKRVIEAWGNPPGEYKNGIPPAMVYQGKIVITGLKFGNVLVCVQPKRGCAGPRCDGRVCKILHDPDVPPPHQYIATYKWFAKGFKANAIIHVGTHGNLEFLPGKGVCLSDGCLPDVCIDTLPNLYIYNADNPPEGTIAKRRSYAVLVDHMQTLMTEAGLPKELRKLESLLEEYELSKHKNPSKLHLLEHSIVEELKKTSLAKEVKLDEKNIHDSFENLVIELHSKLSLVKESEIPFGMHIFGEVPKGERRAEYIYAILKHKTSDFNIQEEVAKLLGFSLLELKKKPEQVDEKSGESYSKILERVNTISKLIVKFVLEAEGHEGI